MRSPGAARLTAVELGDRGDSLDFGTPTPDGQQFLVAVPDRAGPVEPLQLTLNWPALVE